MDRLACRADLCYTKLIKLFGLAMLQTSQTVPIRRDVLTVSNSVPQDNTPCKQCTGPCGRTLPETADFFHRSKAHKNGFLPRCKECIKAYQQEWYKRTDVQDHVKAYRRRTDVRERRRVYQREHPYHYNEEQKARLNDRSRERYRHHPEYREAQARWSKISHSRPEAKERKRVYDMMRWHHPVIGVHLHRQHRVAGHIRRARKKAISGVHTPQQLQALLKRQKHRCYYCSVTFEKRTGKYVYHVDHTFPLSRVAGTDIPANDISYLVLACPTCNCKKRDRFPWEFPEGGRLL